MITIAAFNNKGGVGKTTLTCNIASYFAKEHGKRVLVVDCDPQCNATQLIIGQEAAASMYWTENEAASSGTTIREVLQPIEDGDSSISDQIEPLSAEENRFGVDVIAGHPGFSIVEDRLGEAWHSLMGGDLGGIRKTNWNTALRSIIDEHYDLAFYDLGPSLGSINRSVLLGCEYFFTPMGTDIFSIMGVRNIAEWIQRWSDRYAIGLGNAEKNSPGKIKEYPISPDAQMRHSYIGYTIQQYITKSKLGERRPTKAYEEIIAKIPAEVGQSLGQHFSEPIEQGGDASLGDVPQLYSLVPLAQSVATPIAALQSSDGLVGSQYKQREDFKEILSGIAHKLAYNAGLALGEQ